MELQSLKCSQIFVLVRKTWPEASVEFQWSLRASMKRTQSLKNRVSPTTLESVPMPRQKWSQATQRNSLIIWAVWSSTETTVNEIQELSIRASETAAVITGAPSSSTQISVSTNWPNSIVWPVPARFGAVTRLLMQRLRTLSCWALSGMALSERFTSFVKTKRKLCTLWSASARTLWSSMSQSSLSRLRNSFCSK